MPSVLFNDNETSTYNNVSEAKQTAYSDVYIPLGKKVDKALSQFLNGKLKVNEKIVIDVTSIEVLKATTNELAQALSSLSPLLANKVLEAMTENEIREVVDLGVLTSDQITIGRQAVEPTITVEA
jgi:hypothetical protein